MTEITVPRLGWSMEQGTFLGWLKADGEVVRAGEPLFMLEGDKSAQEIEAVGAGVLRITPDGPKEGDVVLVGAVLGHLVSTTPPTPLPEAERGSRQSIASAAEQGVGRAEVEGHPSGTRYPPPLFEALAAPPLRFGEGAGGGVLPSPPVPAGPPESVASTLSQPRARAGAAGCANATSSPCRRRRAPLASAA